MHKMQKYNIIPNIFSLYTNVKSIPNFAFGEVLKPYQSFEDNEKVHLYFDIRKMDIPNKKEVNKFHFFYHDKVGNIYYKRRFLGPIYMKLSLVNNNDRTILTVNPIYLKSIRVRYNNIFPPGNHLTDLTTINLIKLNYVPIHCSAIEAFGKAIVFSAPPNTGKTFVSIEGALAGYKHISEDIAITDGKWVYGCPMTATLKYYNNTSTKLQRFVNAYGDFIPPLKLINGGSKKTASDYLGHDSISYNAPIEILIFLQRGDKNKIFQLDKEDALRRLIAINRYEFYYFRNPLLRAASYFNSNLSIEFLMERENEILREFIRDIDVYEIYSPSHLGYWGQIQSLLR